MKQILILLLTLSFFIGKAQNTTTDFSSIAADIKSKSKIDKNDKVALELVTSFYDEVLQADKSDLKSSTINAVQNFMKADDSKNKHLVTLVLMYQQHIAENTAKGFVPNAEFQLQIMNVLEQEFQDLYGITPALIYIYKTEALHSAEKFEVAKETIKKGLSIYPTSIPLKVYSYLATKDNIIKNDLITNHPNHWFVQKRGIK